MPREYPMCKIEDLVPSELNTTNPKRKKARENFKRDGGFTEPIEIFELNGELVVRDGVNRTKEWLDQGHTEVPYTLVDPPGGLAAVVRDQWEAHLKLKGFKTITDSSLAERGRNSAKQREKDKQVQIALDALNKSKKKPE